MIELHNPNFSMRLGPGYRGDTWVLCGNVYNHPTCHNGENVQVSRPVSYDRDTKIMTVLSQKTYILINPPEKVEEEIEDTIKRGFYSRH